ncbi:MAG: hypothetical protein IT430_04935 [Phycisphaerales bacterium]|nr:hypothetical protein [Phycisphaerales bacterium]
MRSTTFRAVYRGVLAAAAVVCITACLSGCGPSDTRSAAEIRADLVASMLKGFKQPGLSISVSADRYDAQAQELRGVHVNGKQGLLYAERATITVDENTRAVRMRLFDVIVAQPAEGSGAAEGSEGKLVRYREMVLDDLNAPAKK